jgi:hypothetical protein
METEVARNLVGKVSEFARTQLDAEERALFAMLVAPGVAQAYPEDDVHGFAITDWSPQPLPDPMIDALRAGGLRVEVDPR